MKTQYKKKKKVSKKLLTILAVLLVLAAQQILSYTSTTTLEDLPEYSGSAGVALNNNTPTFTDEEYEKAKKTYINLSELDYLGRCGVAEMSVTKKDLPTAERGDISKVKPSGWKQAFYPDLISKNNGALYNRCHLLMYALSGLNDDERNLITGTVYLNIEGMLPYETAALNFVSKGNRIIYRVTPVFNGTERVARGVHIEAADVKTKGEKFHINAYCYNVQPGIDISYKTGNSSASGDASKEDNIEIIQELIKYFTKE